LHFEHNTCILQELVEFWMVEPRQHSMIYRYLTKEKFQAPVIVCNYPKAIKAFYIVDVLVSKIASESIEISYVFIMYEVEEFCNLLMNGSLMDHVQSFQHGYLQHSVCYARNRLMA
ncbi:UNVERIFIED_CONTAM: hypothetical protein Sangu_2977900, partial [Sesamum angustifolium]